MCLYLYPKPKMAHIWTLVSQHNIYHHIKQQADVGVLWNYNRQIPIVLCKYCLSVCLKDVPLDIIPQWIMPPLEKAENCYLRGIQALVE